VLELAGVAPPPEMEGASFLPSVIEGKPWKRDHVTVAWGPTPTVVTNRWWFNGKVDGSGALLYDLDAPDPFARSVAEEHREVSETLFHMAADDAGGPFPDWLLDMARKQENAPGCSDLAARE